MAVNSNNVSNRQLIAYISFVICTLISFWGSFHVPFVYGFYVAVLGCLNLFSVTLWDAFLQRQREKLRLSLE